jgi:hypothetical protein
LKTIALEQRTRSENGFRTNAVLEKPLPTVLLQRRSNNDKNISNINVNRITHRSGPLSSAVADPCSTGENLSTALGPMRS